MCWAIISNLNHFPAKNTIGLCLTAVQWLQGFQGEIQISAMLLCAFANQRHLQYVKTISDYCAAVLIPSFCKIKGLVLVVSVPTCISACWSKAFLSVHVKLIGIFARYVGFCQCRIVVEQNGARSGSCCGPKATPTVWKCCFWTAAYPQHGGCVPAVQHDTCCPSKWKEMDASGMPFSCGEQRCPCRDCCGNVNLRRKLLAVDKQRLGCRSSLRVSKRHVSHFAGNVELCRAEHPGGSAASSASAPALPGSSSACLENAAWSHRQAGGWFVLLGAPVVLGGQLRAAFLAGLQICSPSLTHPRSAGSLASAQLLWEEGAAVPGLPNPARENQLETLPEKSAIAQQHCEQNIHAAFYMLACKLQCK